MVSISLDIKFNLGSGLGSEEEDEVFSKLYGSNLIYFIQDLMSRCQDKARHMKSFKREYNIMKVELESSKNKIKN